MIFQSLNVRMFTVYHLLNKQFLGSNSDIRTNLYFDNSYFGLGPLKWFYYHYQIDENVLNY